MAYQQIKLIFAQKLTAKPQFYHQCFSQLYKVFTFDILTLTLVYIQ